MKTCILETNKADCECPLYGEMEFIWKIHTEIIMEQLKVRNIAEAQEKTPEKEIVSLDEEGEIQDGFFSLYLWEFLGY